MNANIIKVVILATTLSVGLYAKDKDKTAPLTPPTITDAHKAEAFKAQRDYWLAVSKAEAPNERVRVTGEILQQVLEKVVKEEAIDQSKWQLNGLTMELTAAPPPPIPPPPHESCVGNSCGSKDSPDTKSSPNPTPALAPPPNTPDHPVSAPTVPPVDTPKQ